MKRRNFVVVGSVLIVASMVLPHATRADFEVTGPDGRRILLKDNGTWQYTQKSEADRTPDKIEQMGEAILVLERKVNRGNGCEITVRLENKLPYEIGSLVPYYSVYRASGVIYDTVSGASGFTLLKPGNSQRREIQFAGIPCQDVVRVQVVGGGRCNMGDLDKFTATPEKCLARVRVVESDLVRFDK